MSIKIKANTKWVDIYAKPPGEVTDIIKVKRDNGTWVDIAGVVNPLPGNKRKFILTPQNIWKPLDYFDGAGSTPPEPGEEASIVFAGSEHLIFGQNKSKVIPIGSAFADRYLVLVVNFRTTFGFINSQADMVIDIDGVPVTLDDITYVYVSNEYGSSMDVSHVGMGLAVIPYPTGTSVTLGMTLVHQSHLDAQTIVYVVDSKGYPVNPETTGISTQKLTAGPIWSPLRTAALIDSAGAPVADGVAFNFIAEMTGEKYIDVPFSGTWTEILQPNQQPGVNGYFVIPRTVDSGIDADFRDLGQEVLVYTTADQNPDPVYQTQWGYIRRTRTHVEGNEVYDPYANDGAGFFAKVSFFN